jgi:two-component system sensor histidine kinase DegS
MWQILGKIFSSNQKSFRTVHLYILVIMILLILAIYYSRFLGGYQGFSPLWYLTIIEYFTTAFGILFIIPLIYAAFFLNSQILLFTWLICGALMLPRVTYLSFHLISVVRAYLVFTLPFLLAIFIKTVALWRQMERTAAAEKEEQRQKYLLQVFRAHENERKNVARDLHDSVIQSLIVLTNHAQMIISNNNSHAPDPESGQQVITSREQLVDLRDMTRDISKDIRNICLNLRPYLIDDMGLIPALRWLIDRTKTDTSINLTTEGIERRFGPETELMLYRIIQEAINNILRHSMATDAKIHIQFLTESVKIAIEDNGCGFVLPFKASAFTEEGKLGLIGIQERVKLLNGKIEITSQPGQGTRISIDAVA